MKKKISINDDSNLSDIIVNDDVICIQGSLNFSTVSDLYQKSLPYLSKLNSITVDFTDVKTSNSAGLALMIEWIKYANHQQKKIKFLHVSEELLAIAKVTALDIFLV